MRYRERALAHYQQSLAKVQPDVQHEGMLAARLYTRNIGPHLPARRDAALVDLGCGFGLFLRYLREAGYTNFQGVDICDGFVEPCKQQGFTITIEDNLSFLRKHPEQFDGINLNYVLEHYCKDDALELVEAAHASLRPGGRLIVIVPNMANPITAARSRYMDITHEASYTEESLSYLLEIAGYSQVTCHGVDQFCLPNPLMNLAGKLAGWCFFKLLRVIYLINAVRSTRIYTKALMAVAVK